MPRGPCLGNTAHTRRSAAPLTRDSKVAVGPLHLLRLVAGSPSRLAAILKYSQVGWAGLQRLSPCWAALG